jgi:hypothetical protein
MRTLQEWMGHRDFKTTLIYADHAPSPAEADLVNPAFQGINLGINLKETRGNSDTPNPGGRGFESHRSPFVKTRRGGSRVR